MNTAVVRSALAVALALAAGCAGSGRGLFSSAPPPVTKIVGGKVITTRAVSPRAYEHVTRALLFEEQGQLEEAALEYARALPYDDDAPEVHARLADVLVALERLDEAEEHVKASLAIAATVEGWLADAHLRAARGDKEGALEAHRRAVFLTDTDDSEASEMAHLELADRLLGELDLAGAFDVARRAVRVHPGSRGGRFLVAGIAWAQGRLGDAEAALREILADEPADGDALLLLGQLLAAAGRNAEAEATFHQAIDRAEDPAALAEAPARWLVARGESGKAVALIEDLIGTEEGGASAWARSALERAAGRPARARDIADKALRRGHEPGRMAIAAALAAQDLGRDDDALGYLVGVGRDSPDYVEARLRAVELQIDRGKLDAATKILTEVDKKLAADRAAAQATAASAGATDRGAAPGKAGAKADGERGRGPTRAGGAAGPDGDGDDDSTPSDPVWRDTVVQLWATLDEKRGHGAAAEARLREAEASAADPTTMKIARAALLERLGEWRRAVALAEEILATDATHPVALNFAGFVAADRGATGAELDRAVARVSAALAIELSGAGPGAVGSVLDSVGWAHFRKTDLDRAGLFLEQAARLEPDNAEILSHLGDLVARQGDQARARGLYRKALAQRPDDALKRRLEERVRALGAPEAEPVRSPR